MDDDDMRRDIAPRPMNEAGEDTRAVMMEMRRQNRRSRTVFIVAALLVGAAFGATAFLLSPRETDNMAIALMRGIAWSGSSITKKRNPGATTARVHISISERAPVSIDGDTLGKTQHYLAEFKPGVHHVDVTAGDKIMRQVMKVEAGEEFRVYFNLDAGRIDVGPVE